MKKIATKILSTLALTALGISGTALCFAQIPNAVFAEDQANESTQTTLVAPTSYEQYLSLTEPSDVAVTNGYTAIADGNTIYVYDRKDEVYRKYEHAVNTEADMNKVTKMQFDEANNLYFLDASSFLYYFNANDLTDENAPSLKTTGVPCSTFALYGEHIYFTNVTGTAHLSRTNIDSPNVSTAENLVPSLHSTPQIAFWNGELYYTNGGTYLHKLDPDDPKNTSTPIAIFENDIFSMQIVDGVFTCSVKDSSATADSNRVKYDFYSYGLNDLASSDHPESATLVKYVTPLSHYDGYYGALCAFGNYVYAVKGSSVCQYSVKTSAFTDYEICNASGSPHRLNGGTETLLSGGLLFIADNGNGRISVYDAAQEVFKLPILSAVNASYLASDSGTVLAANETEAVVYDLAPETYGNILAEFHEFNGALVGAANVYGKYYFATENNYYYVAQPDETAENGWSLTEIKKTSTRYPKLLTADAYGDLYVASGTAVYRYSEADFLSQIAEGKEVCDTLPAKTEKILVDYAGNVYALENGRVQKLGSEDTVYALNDPLVYSDTALVRSFTFGIEDNATYLLYEENYLAKTTALELPTVKNIPVNGADESIFDASDPLFIAVETKPNAMLVDFNINELAGATEFPYLAYNRSVNAQTALKIGETDKHAILALYDAETETYTFCLALKADCTELERSAYRTDYETQRAGYLTNEVSLYKYPLLSGLPTHMRVIRNAEVQVLGEITAPDHQYYYVSYTDENGKSQTGYIPRSYVLSFDPTHPEATEKSYGPTERDHDSIWRLAYLVLGTGAICILLDVLILRKKKEE